MFCATQGVCKNGISVYICTSGLSNITKVTVLHRYGAFNHPWFQTPLGTSVLNLPRILPPPPPNGTSQGGHRYGLWFWAYQEYPPPPKWNSSWRTLQGGLVCETNHCVACRYHRDRYTGCAQMLTTVVSQHVYPLFLSIWFGDGKVSKFTKVFR